MTPKEACKLFGGPPPFDVKPFDDRVLLELTEDIGECFWTVRQRVRAPVSLWMQNTADWRHVWTIHAEGFSKVFEEAPPFDVMVSAPRGRSSHKLGVKPEVVDGYARLCGKTVPPYFLHFLEFPDRSMTAFLGCFYSVEHAEWRVDGCEVTTQFYESKTRRLPKKLLKMAADANEVILRQDRVVCETWAKTYRDTGNWLPGEERIQAYLGGTQ